MIGSSSGLLMCLSRYGALGEEPGPRSQGILASNCRFQRRPTQRDSQNPTPSDN